MGGWKAPTPHVPAPTEALVEISIPNLVGGSLSNLRSLAMGALAAAGCKRRGFKEGGLAYGEMTSRGFVNSAALPFRVHVFLNRLC